VFAREWRDVRNRVTVFVDVPTDRRDKRVLKELPPVDVFSDPNRSMSELLGHDLEGNLLGDE
jgi:hypothetical protein